VRLEGIFALCFQTSVREPFRGEKGSGLDFWFFTKGLSGFADLGGGSVFIKVVHVLRAGGPSSVTHS
jgi:hypothetical protein